VERSESSQLLDPLLSEGTFGAILTLLGFSTASKESKAYSNGMPLKNYFP